MAARSTLILLPHLGFTLSHGIALAGQRAREPACWMRPSVALEIEEEHMGAQDDEDPLLPVTVDQLPQPCSPSGRQGGGSVAMRQASGVLQPAGGTGGSRQHFIDAIRVFLTVTVIIHHCWYIMCDGWFPFYGEWLWSNGDRVQMVILSWTILSWNQVCTVYMCSLDFASIL